MFTQYDLIQDSKLNNKAMPVSNVYTFDGPGTISGKKYIDLQYTPDNPKNIQIQILHGTSLVNCEINNLLGEFRLIEDDNGDLKRISWNSPADVPSAFVQTMLDTGDSIFVTYNTKNLVLPEPVMPPAPVFGSLYNSVSEAQADGWKRYFNFNNPFVIVDGNGDVQNVYDVLDETKYLRRYSQVSTNKPKRDEIGKFEHSVYMNGSYGTMYEPVASFSQLGTKIVVSCWVKTLSAKQYSSSTDLGIVSFRCYSGYTKNDVMLYDTFSLCINSSKKKIQVGFRDQVNEDTGYPHQIYKDISNLGFWDANMYGTDIWHNIFIEIPLSVDFQFSSINPQPILYIDGVLVADNLNDPNDSLSWDEIVGPGSVNFINKSFELFVGQDAWYASVGYASYINIDDLGIANNKSISDFSFTAADIYNLGVGNVLVNV